MFRRTALRALMISTCWIPFDAALAQEADPTALDEIVVTALKLGETVLDTPATVTVVQAEELAVANVTSAHQLSGIVPGLFTAQGTSGTSASFRGLGSASADPGIESSVATFVDGVYLGHPRDYVMPIYDVDQIEFLAGTQSTLLGKNTSLGALSITNRRPGKDFAYDVAGSYTTKIDAWRLQGGVDVPLGDSLALRAAVLANDEAGYVRNAFLDRRERQVKELSGRLTLEGELGGATDFTLIYQHDKRRTKGHYLEVLTDPNGSIADLAASLGQDDFDTVGNDISYSGSERLNPADPDRDLPMDDQDGDRATLIVRHEIGGHTLTSQTAYVQRDSTRITDFDFTAAFLVDIDDVEDNEVFSQEVRITSPNDGRLTYLAGLFYYANDWSLTRTINGPDLIGVSSTSADIKTRAWSLFGSGRYELSDRFAVSAGLRYTDEEKTPTYVRESSGPPLDDPFPRTTLAKQGSTELDGDVSAEFRPSEGRMLYARFARGSKSGGFQSSPDTLATAPYDGEVAYTTEAGAKLDLSAGSLTFAVFNTEVDGFQIGRRAVVGGLPQTVISNSSVQATGAEAGAAWKLTPEFSVHANVVYSKARFTEDLISDDGSGVLTLEAEDGMRLPRAPRWTAQAGAKYEQDLNDSLTFRAQGVLRYASSADLQLRVSSPLAPRSEAHTTLDGQVAIAHKAGWEVSLIGSNLTNDRYVTFASDHAFDPDAYYGTRSRPRTIAIQLKLVR